MKKSEQKIRNRGGVIERFRLRSWNDCSRYRSGVGRGCGLGRGRGVTPGVGIAVGVGVGVIVGVTVNVGVAVGVAVGVTVGVTVGVGVGVIGGVGVAVHGGPWQPKTLKLSTRQPSPEPWLSLAIRQRNLTSRPPGADLHHTRDETL
jgi:hypothetical protein